MSMLKFTLYRHDLKFILEKAEINANIKALAQ
jgi:hypothetical protein